MARALRLVVLIMAAAALTGCNVKGTKVPPLSGPSELALSLQLQANPDTISQDGSSQSQLVVIARDANGQPARNVTCRVDIEMNGGKADFGTLSNATITTGSDGRAATIYTAPAPSPLSAAGGIVTLVVTPVGTDFSNALSRTVAIRVVPPAVIEPPVGPYFTITPSQPKVLEHVVIDGSLSKAPSGRPIVLYVWKFGDGEGKQTLEPYTSHDWAVAGSFTVSLTITDDAGATATRTALLTVVPADK